MRITLKLSNQSRYFAGAARLVLLLACAFAGASRSAEPLSLYAANIEVQAQSASEERRALRAGLAEVLVKLSGDRAAAERQEVQAALVAPREFVTSFGFVSNAGALALRVDFSAEAVDQLVRSARLPVWPAQRQPLLLWVQLDRLPLGRHWLDYSSDSDLLAVLDEVMRMRGMPWRLPEFDLRDRLAVADNRALLLDSELLSAASQRYTLPVARQRWAALRLVTSSDGSARGSWVQTMTDQLQQGELAALPELEQWSEWLHAAVDRVVAREAYLPTLQAGEIVLAIGAVEAMRDYHQLMEVLEEIEPLRSVRLTRLDLRHIELAALVEGDRERVKNALLASGFFAPIIYDGQNKLEQTAGRIELIWRGGRD